MLSFKIPNVLTDIFMRNQNWDFSNKLLIKLKQSISASIDFEKSFDKISKNQGLTLLSLDPTESHLQLFHYSQIIGGSWTSPDKKLVAVLGFDSDAKPIQLVTKSIKDFKLKSFSTDEIAKTMDDDNKLKNLKNARVDFSYKNIIVLPYILTKVFISLESTDPITVARAFFQIMFDYDPCKISQETADQVENSANIDSKSEETLEVNSINHNDQDILNTTIDSNNHLGNMEMLN